MNTRSRLLRSALYAMYGSGLFRLAPRSMSGVGVIFMLHRVRPAEDLAGFAPNALLEITPGYLNSVLSCVKALGYDFVSLDEARRRLENRLFDRKFAAFTLDDGYRDNLEHAAPVFAAHHAPFTVYVSSGMCDGTLELWWAALEEVIRRTDHISFESAEVSIDMETETADQKNEAYETIYWPMRNADEMRQRDMIRNLCAAYGVDLLGLTREAALSWNEVRTLSEHAYASIGAHTADHFALSKLTEPEARHELTFGAQRIADETGIWPRHLAYPYGDTGSAGKREFEMARFLGFDTATTTRKGFITGRHGLALHSLPRLSLNGDYQDLRLLKVLMSGVPFAMAERLPAFDLV